MKINRDCEWRFINIAFYSMQAMSSPAREGALSRMEYHMRYASNNADIVLQSVNKLVDNLLSACGNHPRGSRDCLESLPFRTVNERRERHSHAQRHSGESFMQFSSRTLLQAMLLLVVPFVVVGCSSTPPTVYKEEKFDSTDIYSRRFEVSSTVACEAVRRTLLSQGYVIGAVTANQINGTKSFQPRSDAHVQIAFRVVCTDDDAKGDKSSVYVNALEDRYALKKVNNVASLGVGVLGSVSVPFSASDDSLVKVASETISAEGFYARFFDVVEKFLDNGPDTEQEPIDPPSISAKPVSEAPAAIATPVATLPSAPVVAAPIVAPTAVPVPIAAPVPAQVPVSAPAPAPPATAMSAPVAPTPAIVP